MRLCLPKGTSPSSSQALWSYENANWGVDYPQCNGLRQSPINIQSESTFLIPMPALKFTYYDIPLKGPVTLSNNGHSVDVGVTPTINGKRPFITGGTLNGIYEAMGIHFHWGSSSSRGSEHTIDNRRYDAEMHIVHKSIKYDTIEEAIKHPDGLAVLGIMFKSSLKVNRYYPGLNKIFDKLPSVLPYQSSTPISGQISLSQLLGDLNTKHFYTYQGSLTTPGCFEAVTWHVFPEPLAISRSNMEKFSGILDSNDKPMINNYRPVQRLNARQVYYRVGLNALW
uniref:Carbonic anhydrase n=1 Tax=Stomoxys calcitrans TaxID=35570 RepID=A0A1I8PBT6_STOCA